MKAEHADTKTLSGEKPKAESCCLLNLRYLTNRSTIFFTLYDIVIASEAKQSIAAHGVEIASSLRSSQ